MSESSFDPNVIGIVDRLGKLEGLLVGLQTSLNQSQGQVTGFMTRVEGLEKRLVELERSQVTRADLENLGQKVDALAVSDARQRGGVGVLGWTITTVIALAAACAAFAALVKDPSVQSLEGDFLPRLRPSIEQRR